MTARTASCNCFCNHLLVELPRRIVQIAPVDDVVAVENRAGLVPRHFHSDYLRNSSPNQISNSSPPEIVWDPSRQACVVLVMVVPRAMS